MSALKDAYNTAKADNGCLSILTREQDRKLRADAWRHVRRINPVVARKIWIARRERRRLEALEWRVAA